MDLWITHSHFQDNTYFRCINKCLKINLFSHCKHFNKIIHVIYPISHSLPLRHKFKSYNIVVNTYTQKKYKINISALVKMFRVQCVFNQLMDKYHKFFLLLDAFYHSIYCSLFFASLAGEGNWTTASHIPENFIHWYSGYSLCRVYILGRL